MKEYSIVTKDELPRLTIREIDRARMSKADAFKRLDELEITFDYALPQTWLDSFVAESGLNYHLVISTTVYVYRKNGPAGPVSVCRDVQESIEKHLYGRC